MDWGFLRLTIGGVFRIPGKPELVMLCAQGKNEIQPLPGLDEITS